MALPHPSKTSTTQLFHPSLRLILLLLHFPSTTADPLYQICGNTGEYTAKSTYQSNLVHLLSSLTSTNSSLNVSFTATAGQVPDQVYGLTLCRGDVNSSTCLSCLTTATQDIQQICPYYSAATIWYDECELRYSNQQFLSSPSLDSNIQIHLVYTSSITANERSAFNQSVRNLVSNMSEWAAYKSNRSFATAEMNFTANYPKIYGLAQCAADLSAGECSQCLNGIAYDFATKPYFEGSQGGRILGLWCNARYGVLKFYDGASTLSLASLPLSNAPAPTGAAPAPASPVLTPPANGNVESGCNSRGSKTKIITTSVVAVFLVFITILLIRFSKICLRRKKAVKREHCEVIQDITGVNSLSYDLATLRDAINNFSNENKVGEGGFGAVYKGTLTNGQEIAVKRLSRSSGQGLKELKNEVASIAKLQHKNLVRFLGFCLEEQEKLLVYEYVQNKSLDTFIFDAEKREHLDWEKRYKIIRGIAKGLLYLHEDSHVRIIHRDLKASNILLDADMNPKISDFGLARLVGEDHTQSKTNKVVGTYGYMAPEYAADGTVSTKSDVFSFGVLVLEIVSGQTNNSFHDPENVTNLLSYAWECWSRREALKMIDPSLGENYPHQEAMKCIHIGLLCVQENPSDRPSMLSVVLMLNRCKTKIQSPSRPAFFFRNTEYSDSFGGTSEQASNVSSMLLSSNEVTITEMCPR